MNLWENSESLLGFIYLFIFLKRQALLKENNQNKRGGQDTKMPTTQKPNKGNKCNTEHPQQAYIRQTTTGKAEKQNREHKHS